MKHKDLDPVLFNWYQKVLESLLVRILREAVSSKLILSHTIIIEVASICYFLKTTNIKTISLLVVPKHLINCNATTLYSKSKSLSDTEIRFIANLS